MTKFSRMVFLHWFWDRAADKVNHRLDKMVEGNDYAFSSVQYELWVVCKDPKREKRQSSPAW